MIAYLRGRVRELEPSSALVDVGGVGYAVHIPLSTYYELQNASGLDAASSKGDAALSAEVELRIHTHVREDALTLYGFWTVRERSLFERLISVSGIGPRLAQTVLSGMSPDDLVAAIASADIRRLSSIPGVGKKTAERMSLELKEKVRDLAVASPEAAQPLPPADNDLVQALVNLGYKAAAAERAVAEVQRGQPELEFADLLRESLKRLSKV